MKKYSAGSVKYGFWFAEFTKVLTWILAGEDDAMIKQRIVNDNVFELSSVDRRQSLAGRILLRIHALPKSLQSIFFSLDADNQRLTVLISIMKTDLLFESFMLNCFKDSIALGDKTLKNYKLDSFFSDLQVKSEDVAKWQDKTIVRLKGTIQNYLRAAGIARNEEKQLVLQQPLLDTRLISILQEHGNENYIIALTGRTNG